MLALAALAMLSFSSRSTEDAMSSSELSLLSDGGGAEAEGGNGNDAAAFTLRPRACDVGDIALAPGESGGVVGTTSSTYSQFSSRPLTSRPTTTAYGDV